VMVRDACTPAFRTELRKLPGVASVSCSTMGFLTGRGHVGMHLRNGSRVTLARVGIDWGIFALYGIRPLAGSLAVASSTGDYSASDPAGIVINAAAVRALGFASPQAAVGQDSGGRIAAVVPDFALHSVEQPLEPTQYLPGPNPDLGALTNIKLNGKQVTETLAAIDRLWTSTGNTGPISRFFVDTYVQQQYLGLVRQAQLLTGLSILAVVLACLGLFALSVSSTERRTKEVGIRKSMGATGGAIVALLLWQFSLPVLLANVIAWPAAFWLMQRWLSGFAYHVELQWWVFAAASLGALLIALLTVAGQAFLAARQKPVLALRYE
jgi:putative ABC transport system permease protein